MDALEPSEAMMDLAVAKNIYTNHICDYLNSVETSVKSGMSGCLVGALQIHFFSKNPRLGPAMAVGGCVKVSLGFFFFLIFPE